MSNRRVVVTGMGAVSAAGVGRAAFRAALKAGASYVRPITTFDAANFPIRIGGQVHDYQPERYIDRKTLARTARNSHFAFIAAAEALADAGLDPQAADPSMLGAVMATAMGGMEHSERGLVPLFTRGPGYVSPFLATTLLFNSAMSQLSIRYNLQGYTQTVVSETAGGAEALRLGAGLLREGAMDAALVGGCDATLWPGFVTIVAILGLHAPDESDPATAYRPFDRRHSGMVLGEGGALLVLEGEDHARARGARPLAEVAGYAATFDAVDPVGFDPTGEWYAAALRGAIDMAGVSPREVDVVIAEGRGYPAADQSEAAGIARAFDGATPAVTCTKGGLGHTFSAASALDAICAVDMMEGGYIPPIVNLERPGVEAALDFVRGEARPADVRTVLLGARGLSGVNVAVVLRRIER